MQTFLPYPDFAKSAAALDSKRLGNQLLENVQIMTALMKGTGWVSHPATLMWRRYEWALTQYHEAVYTEWYNKRHYKSHTGTYEKLMDLYYDNRTWVEEKVWPYWLGDPIFHDSHKATLIRKRPEWYRPQFNEDSRLDESLETIYPKPEDEYRRELRVIWRPTNKF